MLIPATNFRGALTDLSVKAQWLIEFLRRPMWLDQNGRLRMRIEVIDGSLTLSTLTTVTTVGTVSNISQVGNFNANPAVVTPIDRTCWAMNQRSRIT